MIKYNIPDFSIIELILEVLEEMSYCREERRVGVIERRVGVIRERLILLFLISIYGGFIMFLLLFYSDPTNSTYLPLTLSLSSCYCYYYKSCLIIYCK